MGKYYNIYFKNQLSRIKVIKELEIWKQFDFILSDSNIYTSDKNVIDVITETFIDNPKVYEIKEISL